MLPYSFMCFNAADCQQLQAPVPGVIHHGKKGVSTTKYWGLQDFTEVLTAQVKVLLLQCTHKARWVWE